MHGIKSTDPGREIDWGKASLDYARHRPGPPPSFYERLRARGVGLPGQAILDLGTGTGVLAREFAKQGARVVGTDVSPEQIRMAQELARADGVVVDFHALPAEDNAFPPASFDVITANQSFLYFDRARVVSAIRRMLKPQGLLVTSHNSWLPRLDPIVHATEQLILKHNPQWTAHGFGGEIPPVPYGLGDDFEVVDWFYYDEAIPFTREGWRGRIRASRGIGATLTRDQVEAFDREHDQMLRSMAGESFTILHRIDAHLMHPRGW